MQLNNSYDSVYLLCCNAIKQCSCLVTAYNYVTGSVKTGLSHMTGSLFFCHNHKVLPHTINVLQHTFKFHYQSVAVFITGGFSCNPYEWHLPLMVQGYILGCVYCKLCGIEWRPLLRISLLKFQLVMGPVRSIARSISPLRLPLTFFMNCLPAICSFTTLSLLSSPDTTISALQRNCF